MNAIDQKLCLRCNHAQNDHEVGDWSVGINPGCYWFPEGTEEDDTVHCDCLGYYGEKEAAADKSMDELMQHEP